MSFLSNFNTLVAILLGPTDLLESNQDMTFSISIAVRLEIVVPSTVRLLGISAEMSLTS